MSAPHHGSPEQQAAERRLLDQFLNRSEPAFPGGHLNKLDEGELAFAVAVDPARKVIILRFGKPVDWIGFGKTEALHLANLLKEKADTL